MRHAPSHQQKKIIHPYTGKYLHIVWAVTKFHQYLLGRQFIIKSDHKHLLALFGQDKTIPKMAAGRIQRWAFFLSGFNYTIEFIKCVDNLVADSLSRLMLETENISHNNENSDVVNWVTKHLPIDFLQIRTETAKDSVLKKIVTYVLGN